MLVRGGRSDRDELYALNEEPSVPTSSTEANEIRRQMAAIRHELHQDVRGVVRTAETVADWGRFVGKYPWISLGTGVVVGYLLVPKRKKVETIALNVSPVPGASKAAATLTSQPSQATLVKTEKRSGLLGAAFGMLTPILVRAAQGYALKYIENWIAQQQLAAMGPAHSATRTPPEPRSRTMNS